MVPQKRLFRIHIILSILFSILIISAVCFSFQFGLLKQADLFLYDLHFKWRGERPTSGRIVLVYMDQKSARELERKKGTWSRAQMAHALANLNRAGAEIIGLDMVFFSPAPDEEEDRLLAEAIDAGGNVVLAKFVAVAGQGEVTPLPRFQAGMIGDGFINMFPDQDEVIRKIPFLSSKPVKEGLAISPSFSLEIVRTFLYLDFVFDFSRKDHFRLGAPEDEPLILPFPDLRIHYYGGKGAFQSLSYADVVKNRIPAGSVKGKIVLIGSSLATDKDYWATPFSRDDPAIDELEGKFGELVKEGIGRKSPGVACHAHAVETILNGDFIDTSPDGYVFFFTVLCGLLGLLFYLQRPGPLWGMLILFISLGMITGVSHALFAGSLLWVQIAPLMAVLLVQFVSGIAFQRVYSKKRTQLVTGLFGKYVSQGVVDGILAGHISAELEGRSQEVTVLFTDLRGFTTLSESLSPQETGVLLNTYFDAMIPIVFDHQGTLDKLMGDAIMAFFGAPEAMDDHAVKAAETALDMVQRLEALKAEKAVKGVEHLRVGIGINTGQVTVGNLGSQRFVDYTVIGDTVNLGSRLEGLNKNYGTSIIVSQSTASRLDERFVLRELDLVRVKGKEDAVGIFELVGFREGLDPEALQRVERFETALCQYRDRAWQDAEASFRELLKKCPEDGPVKLYLDRTCALIECPPSSDWECVTVFKTK